MKKTSGYAGFLLVFIFMILFDSPLSSKGEAESIQLKGKQLTTKKSFHQLNKEKFDVIVVGGEPEGVAAAISAARNGAKTLLVEKRAALGGLMTYGMLNFIDEVNGINGKSAVGGIYQEWHSLVGGKVSFDIQQAKNAFSKLVLEEDNLSILPETDVEEVLMDGKKVSGIQVRNKGETEIIFAKRFIDATQDADIAVMAGAPYYLGGEDIHLKERKMAVTLIIHLRDVNWSGIQDTIDKGLFWGGHMNDTVAWGFGQLHHVYIPKEENTHLRGLNLVRIGNGDKENVYINALQIFGINGLDEQSKAEAIKIGKRETKHVLAYLKKEFPGFSNAKIASYPEELYIRETRHIRSEYMLQMSDIWTNKDHWDSIGLGGYPVDVQATSKDDYGSILASPVQYAIPFRTLVPLNIENMAVVGRSAGYSSLAAGSARIIPSGMAVGEAGGAAAALTVKTNQTFRELSADRQQIEELRKVLQSQGAIIDHFEINYPYEGEYFDEAIQFLFNYGLVAAGYDNDLKVDEDMVASQFTSILLNGAYRIDPAFYDKKLEKLQGINLIPTFNQHKLTRDEAAQYLLSFVTNRNVPIDKSWKTAVKEGLVDKVLIEKLPENQVVTNAQGYYWAANILSSNALNR